MHLHSPHELIATTKRELRLTSIVISHDIPSALLLADHIAFLDQGRIIFSGSPSEFRASPLPAIRNFVEAEERFAGVLSSEED